MYLRGCLGIRVSTHIGFQITAGSRPSSPEREREDGGSPGWVRSGPTGGNSDSRNFRELLVEK